MLNGGQPMAPESDRSPSRALLVCVALTFVLHLGMYLLTTQLPMHLLRLGGSHAQIGWLFGVTTLVGLVLRPQVGGWTDRYGARAVMLPGAVALVLTMLILPAAGTPLAVISLMAGLGVGAALISTTGSIVVANESPGDRRGEALSLFYVFSSAGVALGPPLGFALADLGGIRLNFVAVIALSVVTTALVLTLRTRPGNPAAPGGLGRPWSRHAVPASLALIAITAGHSTVYAFLPLYAAAAGRGSAAWFFPLMSGFTILCRLVLRRASDRIGRAPVLVPAIALLALGNAVLALSPSVLSLVLGAALLGCGNSMLYPTLVALVVDRTPTVERGRAIGTLSGAWDVGVAIGAPTIALLVQTHGYAAGFLASALTTALGLTTFLATEHHRRRRSSIPVAVTD
jgi:MFS family permease